MPGFREGDLLPSSVLAQADPAILELARPVAEAARTAEGRLSVPVLEDYEEDSSQYKPRSCYAGNPLLESYCRSMMWLGRISFRAKSNMDTLTGILVMRALVNAPGAYAEWTGVADTLTFLVGPMDDYNLRLRHLVHHPSESLGEPVHRGLRRRVSRGMLGPLSIG